MVPGVFIHIANGNEVQEVKVPGSFVRISPYKQREGQSHQDAQELQSLVSYLVSLVPIELWPLTPSLQQQRSIKTSSSSYFSSVPQRPLLAVDVPVLVEADFGSHNARQVERAVLLHVDRALAHDLSCGN